MKISYELFKGMLPRVSPRALPAGYAVLASNARLLSGDLQPWKNFERLDAILKPLSTGDEIATIYKLGDYWLSWLKSELDDGAVCVDVAKSTIGGDSTDRIFLTGLDRPRYTNLPLAIQSGGPPYPVETRVLGVIAPDSPPTLMVETSSSAAIDVSDNFTTDTGWNFSAYVNSPPVLSRAYRRDDGGQGDSGCIEFQACASGLVYATRDFSCGGSAVVTVHNDFKLVAKTTTDEEILSWNVGNTTTDGSSNVSIVLSTTAPGTFAVSVVVGGSTLATIPCSHIELDTWYGVQIDVTRVNSLQANVRFQILLGSSVFFDQTFNNLPVQGGIYGWNTTNSFVDRGTVVWRIDNFHLVATAPAQDTTQQTATSYVYTFVNDIGEESAPSPASDTIIRDNGTKVTVTTSISQPTGDDYNVETKRIYRAVTGITDTVFKFVAEIPLAQIDYDDTLTDSQLGETLESDNWDLPPLDMRGILALPNDIYCGFSGNELCFSVQGRPHAWPVAYRLRTDFPIVAIGAIDTSVVITTKGFPYIAAGNSPDAYSMEKLEYPQACVSKRSLTYLKGFGVVYASPDGLVAIAGPGKPQLLTEQVFAREEWQALYPETIIATVHDNRYFAFIEQAGDKTGFMVDIEENGGGYSLLSFHATAVFSNLIDDTLNLVLDQNDSQPWGSSGQVNPDGDTIYVFDSDAIETGLDENLTLNWISRDYKIPFPACFQVARIRTLDDDYSRITIRFIANGVQFFEKNVTSGEPFTIPIVPSDTSKISITTQNRIISVEVAEDIGEIS